MYMKILFVISISLCVASVMAMTMHIAKNMKKKQLGATSMVAGTIGIVIWNYVFRDSSLIPSSLFWIGFCILALVGFLGIIIFAKGVISGD